MAGEELISYYEELMERLPSEGLAAARARTLVSRFIAIVETVRGLLEKAACIAERSGGCKPSDLKPCETECASLMATSKSIWRYKRPFVASFTNGSLRLQAKDTIVTLERGTVRVALPAGTSYYNIEVKLDTLGDIMREYQTLIYALKKVEAPLRIAQQDLETCSKMRQLAC